MAVRFFGVGMFLHELSRRRRWLLLLMWRFESGAVSRAKPAANQGNGGSGGGSGDGGGGGGGDDDRIFIAFRPSFAVETIRGYRGRWVR